MEETEKKNPWLGLQSYQEGEVIYGRDEDICDLTQSVLNDTNTLLYGKSGIGKSSILNAGVVPSARRNGYVPVQIRLSHKETESYLSQIHTAILQTLEKKNGSIKVMLDRQNPGGECIYEYFHRHTFLNVAGQRMKLLIIFDQFEEIFTLQDNEQIKRQFFAELADQLNDVMPAALQKDAVEASETQEVVDLSSEASLDDLFGDFDFGSKADTVEYIDDNDIHLVFTIREDFLSEFEYYTSSIPSLKQNRYGLRPINEEQAAQIIMLPQPGLISKEVAKLIIEKVTGRTDFDLDGLPEIEVDSAVLSLYLNRLYDAKTSPTITRELVEEKGGEIISDFYHDAISSISESSVEYLEDKLLNGQGRRDNIIIFDAINDGNVTEEELHLLCNKKKILRRFNYAGDLRIEFVHDILCPVVKQHKDARALRKQQEEEQRIQEEEKRRFMEEEQRKRKEMEEKALRDKRRTRRYMITALSIIITSVAVWAMYLFGYRMSYEEYYADYTTVNGWPVGIGDKLSKSERENFHYYYCLKKNGRLREHFTSVELKSSVPNEIIQNNDYVMPVIGKNENGTDVAAAAFADLHRRTTEWRFMADEKGNLSRRVAYDRDGNTLYAVNIFQDIEKNTDDGEGYMTETEGEKSNRQVWMLFTDSYGRSMPVRDNAMDRMRAVWDKNGMETQVMFYTQTGTPVSNHENCYGYAMEYDSLKHFRTLTTMLDPVGMPMLTVTDAGNKTREVEYNTYVFSAHDTFGRAGMFRLLLCSGRDTLSTLLTVRNSYSDGMRTETLSGKHAYGVARRCHMTDRYNRDTLVTSYDDKGRVTHTTEHRKYDNLGHLTLVRYTDGSGKPAACPTDSGYTKKVFQYAGKSGNTLVTERRYRMLNGRESVVYSREDKLDKSGSILLTRTCYNASDSIKNWVKHYEYANLDKKDSTLTAEEYRTLDGLPLAVGTYHRKEYATAPLEGGRYYKVMRWRDVSGRLTNGSKNKGAVDSLIFDGEDKTVAHVLLRADGSRLYSYLYEYDSSGTLIAQAVMGVDGTPVRYPDWDIEGISYYKVLYKKDFKDDWAFVRAVNEWDSKSCFAQSGRDISFHYNPSTTVFYEDRGYRNNSITYISMDLIPASQTRPTIHIEHKEGAAYQSGLRDNDILTSGNWSQAFTSGGTLTVKRYDSKAKAYLLHDIKISKGTPMACTVNIYYTAEECSKIDNAKKK